MTNNNKVSNAFSMVRINVLTTCILLSNLFMKYKININICLNYISIY